MTGTGLGADRPQTDPAGEPEDMVRRSLHHGPPRPLYSAIEARSLVEAALLPAALPLLALAPSGDGHPVLLLPGFLGDERSLVALKLFLRGKGYQVETWGLGRNVGFQQKHVRALPEKLRHLHFKTGRRVSLVGWSLGGVFSLYCAHIVPQCVRSVVTLGSPVSTGPGGGNAPAFVQGLYRLVAHPMGGQVHAMQPKAKPLRDGPLPDVPVSCLYSRTDGVVPPQEATIDGLAGRHENIQVAGSHVGLGFNGLVLAIVADRLAQPEDAWQPFRPAGPLGMAQRLALNAESFL